MLHTLRTAGPRRFLLLEVPPFAVAMTVADAYFRFGSFALEALAFAGVWIGIGVPYQALVERLRRGTLAGWRSPQPLPSASSSEGSGATAPTERGSTS
jgi:hypothetical protein